MNIEFSGKTVIITGASHGFRRTITQTFVQRRAIVQAYASAKVAQIGLTRPLAYGQEQRKQLTLDNLQ